MKIIFRMAVRDMLPETFNAAARQVGRPLSAEEHHNIELRKEVDWTSVPRREDEIRVLPDADPRTITSVTWDVDGVIELWLEDLDTDEIADEEAVVIEELLDAGWEIDFD